MPSPELDVFLNLAAANHARGDLTAAAAALAQARERAASADDRAAVDELAARLGVAPRAAPPSSSGRPRAPASPSPRRGRRATIAPELVDALAPEGLLLPVVEVVAELLSADADVRSTAELALGLVARATGAERAHLVIADAERTAFGLPGGPPRPPTTSQGVLDEVARTRATVHVGDARRDPRFGDRPSVQALELRSVLCVPVLADGGQVLVGALHLDGPPGRFGARERAVVESLAALVGPQLWSARRREEAERGRERAERLLARERERREAPALLGRSPAIAELRRAVDRVAPGEHAVLIEGESGAGKELVARLVHARSPRAEGPFVAESVGALAGGLVEAELFGHERGAFTGADQARQGLFQLAAGGTLLLDEVAEAPLELQAKLLRVLEEREVRPLGGARSVAVDVRVLAATNKDLQAEVRAGRFREDLYYRLSTLRLRVPPLRERPGDVPLLLEHFLAREAAAQGRPPPVLPPDLLERLAAHAWPGNVRELAAYAARVLVVGPHEPEPLADVVPDRLAIQVQLGDPPLELRDARAAFDRAYLAAVLARYDGNVTAAARALGMNRSHLSVLVSRFDLRRE